MTEPVWALGLMSGTSLDGVDAAMILTDGDAVHAVGPSAYRPYEADERDRLRAALAAAAARPDAPLDAAARLLADVHAEACEQAMATDGAPDPAVVGFHGQTVLHQPERGFTRQIGDAQRLAERLRIEVVHDFRTADMAAGGQGAPLAPFYHFAIARTVATAGSIGFLNLGGVANATVVDASAVDPAQPGALAAFDAGPANALLDDFVRMRTGAAYDADGALAAQGSVDAALLRRWMAHSFFVESGPRSLDRNEFADVLRDLDRASTEDGAATLTAFTVESAAVAIERASDPSTRWLACGGGRKNATLMAALSERLGRPVEPIEAIGWNGDMIEAQAFAHLAVRSMRGLALSAPGTTGVPRPTTGGVRVLYSVP